MYSNYYQLIGYLQQLHQFVEKQNERITGMELMINQLQTQLREVQQRPTTNIERIEYKFDQLKVETLEGTLNIGLNPTDGEAIEDFAVSQGSMNVPNARHSNQQFISDLEANINDYLDNECYQFIESLEQQTDRSLDDSYRAFIIDDIRNQINERIHFYLKKYQNELEQPSKVDKVFNSIIKNVKKDIQNSIEAFITNMPNQMKGGDGQ